jgi:hypothetical protein
MEKEKESIARGRGCTYAPMGLRKVFVCCQPVTAERTSTRRRQSSGIDHPATPWMGRKDDSAALLTGCGSARSIASSLLNGPFR